MQNLLQSIVAFILKLNIVIIFLMFYELTKGIRTHFILKKYAGQKIDSFDSGMRRFFIVFFFIFFCLGLFMTFSYDSTYNLVDGLLFLYL